MTKVLGNTEDRITYLRELLNTAAVQREASALGGAEDLFHAGMTKGVALALAALTDSTERELQDQARARAKRIFQQGEDWRRELKLHLSLLRRFA